MTKAELLEQELLVVALEEQALKVTAVQEKEPRELEKKVMEKKVKAMMEQAKEQEETVLVLVAVEECLVYPFNNLNYHQPLKATA